MLVSGCQRDWPEAHQRTCRWLPVDVAITYVSDEGLKSVIGTALTELEIA
jgi:hypothetical protein